MIEREAVTSALAGPLVNARATSAAEAPCAPTPGRSRTAWGMSRRASATARGDVAPTTAPTLDTPRAGAAGGGAVGGRRGGGGGAPAAGGGGGGRGRRGGGADVAALAVGDHE